jgi:D-alanyl-D-alanine dipeptidase
MRDEFVFVDEVAPGICWDAKYATWDNFTGNPVDGYLANRIIGTRALCAVLEKGYVSARSGHSRGSTVDLTLYHLATGELAPWVATMT